MRILFAVLALMSAVPAFAAYQGPGAVNVTRADQVGQAPDDAPCVLQGNIVRQAEGTDDKYVFRDDSGQVVVEIDSRVFAGRTVTADMIVRLHGEVDAKTVKANEVDVQSMEIVKP